VTSATSFGSTKWARERTSGDPGLLTAWQANRQRVHRGLQWPSARRMPAVLGSKCTKIRIAPIRLKPDVWRMAEPLIIQSLKDKRAEIHGRIAAYQAQIAQAKHELAHINASIRLFTDPDHHGRAIWSATAFSRRARSPIFVCVISRSMGK
jgi:hypothetical protein